ncbi:GNAT superfamily N-acetyltransferase [Deinobacterium chartae]|uniref:GNAT superfamily N-acetyltransferase n=1 Tax=Deinobacterium chartae TaxID=521158 RepID=A0A841I1P9_9DEIO|nr:GNAT family N-acetyltransferase [Deinobacterium chartae]MBB6098350.1 GNAT superfamily N-acetyltransferase [Deinobacterium chartae]
MTATPLPDILTQAASDFLHSWFFSRTFAGCVLDPRWPLAHVRFGSAVYGRLEEYLALTPGPDLLAQLEPARSRPHWLSLLAAEPGLSAALEAAGYRAVADETLMRRETLEKLPEAGGTEVRRVRTAAALEALCRRVDYRMADPARVHEDGYRQYVAWLDGEPAGWARCVVVNGAAVLDRVMTRPQFRRRGVGRALTLRALHEARAAGAERAALVASSAGVPLYRSVGFERVADSRVLRWDLPAQL